MDYPKIFSKLMVRPQPSSGEGQWGFWLRTAHENGLQRPQWLLSPGSSWPTGMLRVCADCLRSRGSHWRSDWLQQDAFWCSQHLRWLIDECPSCHRRLRWTNVRYLECGCGFELPEAETEAVDPAIVAAVSAHAAPLDVLRALGAFALHGPLGKVGKKAARTTVGEARQQLEAGIVVASDWPDAFFRLLDDHQRRQGADGAVRLLRDALPGLAQFAALISDVAWRGRVATAIDSYCARTLVGDAPIVGRNGLLSSGPMTLKEVAGRLGHGVSKVARAIDSKSSAIRGTRVTAKGRRRRVVAEEDLPGIATLLEETVSVKHAGRLLALPPSRVKALISAGLLSPRDDGLARREVLAIARWPGGAAPVSSERGPYMHFRLVLRNWIRTGTTADFVRAVLAGELSVAANTRSLRLGAWQVSLPEVRVWVQRDRNRETSTLTMSQASSAMSLKHDVVLGLVRSGLLPATKGSTRGRRSWQILEADLVAFQARYVPLSGMALEVGARPRDAFAWAQAQGLRLACGPRVDGSRQYFVDLAHGLGLEGNPRRQLAARLFNESVERSRDDDRNRQA